MLNQIYHTYPKEISFLLSPFIYFLSFTFGLTTFAFIACSCFVPTVHLFPYNFLSNHFPFQYSFGLNKRTKYSLTVNSFTQSISKLTYNLIQLPSHRSVYLWHKLRSQKRFAWLWNRRYTVPLLSAFLCATGAIASLSFIEMYMFKFHICKMGV